MLDIIIINKSKEWQESSGPFSLTSTTLPSSCPKEEETRSGLLQ